MKIASKKCNEKTATKEQKCYPGEQLFNTHKKRLREKYRNERDIGETKSTIAALNPII